MKDWIEGDIASNGIQMHFTRTGGNKPALVLAHGVTDDGLCWSPIATALATDYDVIMVDARGHGRSEATDDGYDSLNQAHDLAGLITGLGLEKPLIMGHSMGAASTLALAGTFPDLPKAIVLEDPPAFWLPGGWTRPSREGQNSGLHWILGIKRQTHAEIMRSGKSDSPTWPEAEFEPWANAKQRLSVEAAVSFASGRQKQVDWEPIIQGLRVPTLMVSGDVDHGSILTQEGIDAIKAVKPHVEVAHIPGSGHNIRRDQPAAFLDALRPFLAAHTG